MKLNKQLLCKLLLTTGITLCTACSYEGQIKWYQEYTDSPIEELDVQVMDKNPFYKNQPQEEQIYYLNQLIMNNPTMSELQKYWTLDYQPLLLKLLQIDSEFVFNALNHLQISTADFHNNNLQGIYYENLLLLDQDLEDKEEATFKHELVHCVTKRITHNDQTLYFLEEGLAAIISDEYGGSIFNTSYRDIATVLKMLIDVIGTYPFYQMLGTGNIDAMIQSIEEIDENIDIEQILNDLNVIYQDGGIMNPSTQETLQTHYIPTIQYLYEKKKNSDMYDSLEMNYYINFLNRNTITFRQNNYYMYLDRCYFNTDGYPCMVLYDENFNYYNHFQLSDWLNITSYQKTLVP